MVTFYLKNREESLDKYEEYIFTFFDDILLPYLSTPDTLTITPSII